MPCLKSKDLFNSNRTSEWIDVIFVYIRPKNFKIQKDIAKFKKILFTFRKFFQFNV